MRPQLTQAGWTVVLHDDRFAQDESDTTWMAEIAREEMVILTRDKHLRRRPDEIEAIVNSGARVVFVAFSGNMHSYLAALLAGANALQRVFDEQAPPVAVRLHRDGGVERIALPG